MAKINVYVINLSYRTVGSAVTQYIDKPTWNDIKQKLLMIEEGQIVSLSLAGPEKDYTHMAIIGKPGHYHIAIFIDEDEEYLYKASEANETKVDIAGNYWPEYQVCKNWTELNSIVKYFFEKGKPSESFKWIYFSDED